MNTTVTELPFLAYNFASAVNCVPMPPLFVGPSNSHVIKTIFSFFRPLVSFQRRSFSFDACFAAEMSGKPVENFGDDSDDDFGSLSSAETTGIVVLVDENTIKKTRKKTSKK